MSKYPAAYAILEKFGFETPPVGVKFLPVKPKGIPRLDRKLEFCAMLVEAQNGKAFYVTKDDFDCIGAMLLGMVDVDPNFESGRMGPKLGVYKEDRANRRIYDYLPRIKGHSVNYAAFAPLDKMTFEPDELIIMASVSQAEILNRARSFATGEMWSARGTPVAGCAWIYLYPYLTGEINFTITGFGFGMKARKLFPEGRILMTIPWDRLNEIMKNLTEMPWVPESYTLGPEGHRNKLKKIHEELARES
jgi:uncharacterized protein (DUF169 family)